MPMTLLVGKYKSAKIRPNRRLNIKEKAKSIFKYKLKEIAEVLQILFENRNYQSV